MNTVEYLQSITFSELARDEQIQIKARGRPTPPLRIQQKDKGRGGDYVRCFKETMYDLATWICGCEEKDALFCFPCLLYGGDSVWTQGGVTDLKHLAAKAQKHEQSIKHIHNVINLSVIDTVATEEQIDSESKRKLQKYDKKVKWNREALSKIINCIKFCVRFELPLRTQDETIESENPALFPDLLDFACSLDPSLHNYVDNGRVYPCTSTTMQYELLESMSNVCKNKIREEIKKADFLAVMCDEATDVNDEMLTVIILRYELQGKPMERFWGCFTLMNPTAEAFASILLKELEVLLGDSQYKLIAQTYDGSVPLAGIDVGVPALVKSVYINAHFIHCYTHQLSFILEQAVSNNTAVRVFLNSLSGIPIYFSKCSPKINTLGLTYRYKIPSLSTSRSTGIESIAAVLEMKEQLIVHCSFLETSRMTDTGFEAAMIKRILSDSQFEFWMEFFSKLMPHVDVMFPQLNIDAAKTDAAVEAFTSMIESLRDECDPFSAHSLEQKRIKLDADESAAAREVCDVVLSQCRERFSFTDHLEASKLVLVRKFPYYSMNFPSRALTHAASAYPMLEKDKLKSELAILYVRDDLCRSEKVTDLLEIIKSNNLQTIFTETVKLLKLLITTPMTTTEDERCLSTLKRVKTFLRGATANESLPALAMVTIESDLIAEMENFNEQVIDHFGTTKNTLTNASLLYSNIKSTSLRN